MADGFKWGMRGRGKVLFSSKFHHSEIISFLIDQVGGKWNHLLGRVEKPFQGVIAGLVLNKVGLEILQP